MIVQIFGAIDLIAAALLYFGEIPGPEFVVNACILILLFKGLISFYPFPLLYLPGFLMSATDAVSVALLYFGTVPLPEVKTIIIAVLLVKSVPSLVSALFLLAGIVGGRKR